MAICLDDDIFNSGQAIVLKEGRLPSLKFKTFRLVPSFSNVIL
jgi:hypothetical protein